jgi:HAD superfamily hydrolase (TIGR01484 family)
MELIVFDLDGTLLNRELTISDYTSETLKLLSKREIAYTVETGRTLHGARAILEGHRFDLPQAYKNGVMEQERFSNSTTLTASELSNVVQACLHQRVTPFVFTLDEDHQSTVHYPALQTEADRVLVQGLCIEGNVKTRALDELPQDAVVTHINSIGAANAINAVVPCRGGTAARRLFRHRLRADNWWRWNHCLPFVVV